MEKPIFILKEKIKMGNKALLNNKDKILFEEIIEEATVDCYNEYEQISGWVCVLEENIPSPCKCLIGKEIASLEKIDTNSSSSEIFGIIKLNKTKIRIPIEDILLEDPNSMKYIDAYRYWRKHG